MSLFGRVQPDMPKVPKIKSLHLFAIYPEKHGGGGVGGRGVKLIFYLRTNPKVFVKLIVSLWVCAAKHAESNENNKFTISFQYLKENVKGEIDLLPTDKRQRFLQTAFIILGVCDQPCPNYPK